MRGDEKDNRGVTDRKKERQKQEVFKVAFFPLIRHGPYRK
jgi:hypothetical protein